MNVFLLNGTPIQLLIAEEIKHVLDIHDDNAVLAIRNVKDDTYKFRIKDRAEVLLYGKWKEVHFIPQIRFKNFFEYIKNSLKYIAYAEKIIKQYDHIDNIFLGNYGNEPMRHIANKYSSRGINITFLDEGIGTIQLYDQRERYFLNKKKSLKNFFKKNIIGFDGDHIRHKVSFFTSYTLEPNEHTNILSNNHSLLKARIKEFSHRNEIIILGNPFSEKGYCSTETYTSWLLYVKKYFATDNITYVAHPRERHENCELYAKQLAFNIVYYELPFELQLLKEKVLPAKIISFASTALTNSFDLYGDSCEHYCFIIPMSEIFVKKEAIKSLYQHIQKNYTKDNFKFIQIPGSI